MKNLQKKGERGFTLIETVVAIFFLTISLVSIMAVLIGGVKANTLAKNISYATTAGLDKIENLRDLDFATDPSVQVGGSLENDILNYNDTYPPNPGPTDFTYQVRWQVFDNTAAAPNQAPTPNTRLVVVNVFPTLTLSGTSKLVELRALLIDRIGAS